eukprot:scaffold130668_cov30-Prasinocladus_malaysianus.AAC.1
MVRKVTMDRRPTAVMELDTFVHMSRVPSHGRTQFGEDGQEVEQSNNSFMAAMSRASSMKSATSSRRGGTRDRSKPLDLTANASVFAAVC